MVDHFFVLRLSSLYSFLGLLTEFVKMYTYIVFSRFLICRHFIFFVVVFGDGSWVMLISFNTSLFVISL